MNSPESGKSASENSDTEGYGGAELDWFIPSKQGKSADLEDSNSREPGIIENVPSNINVTEPGFLYSFDQISNLPDRASVPKEAKEEAISDGASTPEETDESEKSQKDEKGEKERPPLEESDFNPVIRHQTSDKSEQPATTTAEDPEGNTKRTTFFDRIRKRAIDNQAKMENTFNTAKKELADTKAKYDEELRKKGEAHDEKEKKRKEQEQTVINEIEARKQAVLEKFAHEIALLPPDGNLEKNIEELKKKALEKINELDARKNSLSMDVESKNRAIFEDHTDAEKELAAANLLSYWSKQEKESLESEANAKKKEARSNMRQAKANLDRANLHVTRFEEEDQARQEKEEAKAERGNFRKRIKKLGITAITAAGRRKQMQEQSDKAEEAFYEADNSFETIMKYANKDIIEPIRRKTLRELNEKAKGAEELLGEAEQYDPLIKERIARLRKKIGPFLKTIKRRALIVADSFQEFDSLNR